MAKTNYNKMSNKPKEDVKKEVEPIVEEVAVEVEKTVEDEPQVTMTNPIGVVVNCEKLNVRQNSSVKSASLGVISKGTEVEIFEDSSTEDFYSVLTPEGFNGYCMKKYISVK
jgi:uncharacterized protein YgiM (DUF1202 family)